MPYYAHHRKLHPHTRHAVKRAKSRYGVGLPVVRKLQALIRRNDQEVLRSLKQTATRALYEVRLEGNLYYPIYSSSTNCIVTLLPVTAGQEIFEETSAAKFAVAC